MVNAGVARSRASRPRPSQDRGEETIQLADVTERERAQERATRRWCHHPMPQHLVGGTRAQHINIVDAVTPTVIEESNVRILRPGRDPPGRPPRSTNSFAVSSIPSASQHIADQAQPGVRHRVVVVEK